VAETQTTTEMNDFLKVYRNVFVDLPLTWVGQRLGLKEEKETTAVAWKGYDSSVQLANSGVESLYRSPLFGKVLGRSLEEVLRWQQVNKTVTEAFFTALWRSVGLPTADETQALRTQVEALREELRAQSDHLTVKPKVSQTSPKESRTSAPHEETIISVPTRTNGTGKVHQAAA
jgi:hypothetical protein